MVLLNCRMTSLKVIQGNYSLISRMLPVISKRMYSAGNGEKKILSTTDYGNEKPKVGSTMPQYHLSSFDKITLKLFGNLKGEIPSEVSYATMEKAESKRRIAVNLGLIAFCGLGSAYVVYNVKKDLKNHTEENIYVKNVKRYEHSESEHN